MLLLQSTTATGVTVVVQARECMLALLTPTTKRLCVCTAAALL
jgi:hypothetical protein